MDNRPIIGITMGDAAGVGPEIIMKSLAHASVYEQCRPVVIGDAARLRDAGRRAGVDLEVRAVGGPSDGAFHVGVVDCIDMALIPADLPYGKLSAIAGDAAYQYIARTVELTSKASSTRSAPPRSTRKRCMPAAIFSPDTRKCLRISQASTRCR